MLQCPHFSVESSHDVTLFDPMLDCFQQLLFSEGLGQERNCSGLHGPNRHRDVAMASDKYNREIDLPGGELLLKVRPAYSGESKIEDQTSRCVGTLAGEKFLRCSKSPGPKVNRSQQSLLRDKLRPRSPRQIQLETLRSSYIPTPSPAGKSEKSRPGLTECR